MIDLGELRNLLVREISEAERRVIEGAHRCLPSTKEDTITDLFIWEAEKGLKNATDSGRVAEAVRADLEDGYHTHGLSPPAGLRPITEGVVARLRRQQPSEEAKTGGDFELLLVEPQFQFEVPEQLDLQRGGLKQGLLVQAKRRYCDGRWNQLTKTQYERLPQRVDYAALLRYEYADYECQYLQAFRWHPLLGRSISDADQWLKRGDFPDSVATSAVVAGLSRGEYGTNKLEIIEREICPDAGRCVIIEVDWPDRKDPGALVESVNWEVAERAHRGEEAVQVRTRS